MTTGGRFGLQALCQMTISNSIMWLNAVFMCISGSTACARAYTHHEGTCPVGLAAFLKLQHEFHCIGGYIMYLLIQQS